MEKKHFFVLFISTLLFLTAFFLLQKKQTSFNQQKVTIRNHPFMVEIADTDGLRTKGLSGRKDLSPNAGMLFLFPQKGIYSFWMKDMRFPLDFIWIANHQVVGLNSGVLPPSQTGNVPTVINPVNYADQVLEVNAGFISQYHIQVQDPVMLNFN